MTERSYLHVPAEHTAKITRTGGPDVPHCPPDLAAELVEAVIGVFPDHQPGTRPTHSYGVVARGWFEPSEVARSLTTAGVLTAGAEVTARFSNGTGDAGRSDARRSVQGMAVRLHPRAPHRRWHQCGEGGPHRGTDEAWDAPVKGSFDLVSTTLPVFYVHTVEAFREFLAAATPPWPPVKTRWWRRWCRLALDYLNLRTPLGDPDPGDPGVLAYSARRPETCPALAAQFNADTPESFANRSYHAAHAFKLTDKDAGSRFVRFSWEPVDGVRNVKTDAEHFLLTDLTARGRQGPIRFVLRATVADAGDDTANPARPWPRTRRRLVLGLLTLDCFTGDSGENLEFNPWWLPDGVEPDPDDEIFRVRGAVYKESVRRRKAHQTSGRASCPKP